MFEARSAANETDRAIASIDAPTTADASFALAVGEVAHHLEFTPERTAAMWGRITNSHQVASRAAGVTQHRRPRPLSRLLLVASSLALVVAVVVTLNGPFGQADAKELVSRMERGATDPSAIGLTRYVGDLRARSWLTADGGHSSVPLVANQHVSFEAPNRIRLETTPIGAAAAGSLTILTSDGTSVWLSMPSIRQAVRLDPVPSGTLSFLAGTGMQTALENASSEYSVAIVGTETVAGRNTDRVVLAPRVDSAAKGRFARIELSIDRERSIALVGRFFDQGNRLEYEWVFNRIDFRPTFDSSLFLFVPDANTAASTPGVPTSATPDARWIELAGSVQFQLFRPTYRSTTLEIGLPSLDHDRIVVAYHSANNIAAILVIESAGAGGAVEPGDALVWPGGGGTYRQDPDRQRLILRREGTRIEIQAGLEINHDDLVNVAVSLTALR